MAPLHGVRGRRHTGIDHRSPDYPTSPPPTMRPRPHRAPRGGNGGSEPPLVNTGPQTALVSAHIGHRRAASRSDVPRGGGTGNQNRHSSTSLQTGLESAHIGHHTKLVAATCKRHLCSGCHAQKPECSNQCVKGCVPPHNPARASNGRRHSPRPEKPHPPPLRPPPSYPPPASPPLPLLPPDGPLMPPVTPPIRLSSSKVEASPTQLGANSEHAAQEQVRHQVLSTPAPNLDPRTFKP